MQFKTSKADLKSALSIVSKAIAIKSTIPVLEGVLFALTNGALSLTAYDLEIGITTTIAAEAMDTGKFIVQPKLLLSMLNKLSKDDVEFVLLDNALTITSGRTQFTTAVQNDDFPALPTVDTDKTIIIKQDVLKSMIGQTIFSAAQNSTKPVLTGELFELENNVLSVVALDGYRLAVRTENIIGENIKKVIPAKALAEVKNILSDNSDCSINVSDKHAIFNVGDYMIFTRLLEGEFHPYKNSIPTSHTTEITVHTRGLIDSLERCLLLINDRIKSPVRCVFEGDKLQVSCKTQIGKINDTVEIEMTGQKVDIGFNIRYLLDALKATESDKVLIRMDGANKPAVIKPLEGNGYTMLVLPVRMKTEEK